MSQAEKERKEGTRQLIGPEARCCSAPSLAPSVCFPARIPQSEGLTGIHTGASSQHLFPSQNTVGCASDTWNEYFLPCPVPCLFVCFCLCFGLGGFIVCLVGFVFVDLRLSEHFWVSFCPFLPRKGVISLAEFLVCSHRRADVLAQPQRFPFHP